MLIGSGFDAMECGKGTYADNKKLDELAWEYHIPCVYNSGAYSAWDLRNTYNVCDYKVESIEDLKQAIKEEKCRRFAPADYRIASLPDLIY